MKNIMFVSSEIFGIVSTGGLAKVSAEYCIALKEEGYNVILAMPKYGFINDTASNGEDISYITSFEMDTLEEEFGRRIKLNFQIFITHIFYYKENKKIKIPVYLIGNDHFFNEESSENIYSYMNGSQNFVCEKFLLFCKGILEMIPILSNKGINIKPDIIHCNDWHVSPICLLLKDVYSKTFYYKDKNISLVFTVHNSLYHGYCDVGRINFVSECYKKNFITKDIESKGYILFLAIGIMYADYITTVSEKHAEELCTKLHFSGEKMLLKLFNNRRKKGEFQGILNGIVDNEENNPIYMDKIINKNILKQYEEAIHDLSIKIEKINIDLLELKKNGKAVGNSLQNEQKRLIFQLNKTISFKNNLRLTEFNPSSYTIETLQIKNKNKLELQKVLGLPLDIKIPIILISGRLCYQKGIDILYQCIPKIINENKEVQIIIKGIATPQEKAQFETPAIALEKKFKKNVRAILNFYKGEVLKLYSACDILLMPSVYEPCGLVQMEAAKYGCIPVCSVTGGFEDSVIDYEYCIKDLDNVNQNLLIGFKFPFSKSKTINRILTKEKDTPEDNLITSINKAINLFKNDKQQWEKITRMNMTKDFSWNLSVQQYLKIYHDLYNKKQLELSKELNEYKKKRNTSFQIYYNRKFNDDYNYWGIVLYSKNNSSFKIINFDSIVTINNMEYGIAEIDFSEIELITDKYKNLLWIGIHKNGINLSKEEQRYLDFSNYANIKKIYLIEYDQNIYLEPVNNKKYMEYPHALNKKIEDNHTITKYNDAEYLKKFHEKFEYKKCDLGFSTYYDKRREIQIAVFKTWIPLAQKIELLIYNSDFDGAPINVYDMKKSEKGVWFINLPLNFVIDKFYTFRVNDKNEIIDIYAKACSVDAKKGAIINFEKTNPIGWKDHKRIFPQKTNLTIYEMHVWDFTRHTTAKVDEEIKGKFKGVISKLEYIKQMGVDCIQILPITKFDSKETGNDSGSYRWGYDQIGCWFLIEGLYCTNPIDPYNRIMEFKELIQACHEAGIRVILDMAYTHVSEERLFDSIVPDYYFRQTPHGARSLTSYGSEIATERNMVQKLIIDSLKYLVNEYSIDGFRFDFMTSIDVFTVKKIEKELRKINRDIVIYGEANPTKLSAISLKLQSCWQNMHKFKYTGVFTNTSSAFPIRGRNDIPGLCTNIRIDMNFNIFNEGSKGYMLIFDFDTFATEFVNNRFSKLLSLVIKNNYFNNKFISPMFGKFINIIERKGRRKCAKRLVHTVDTHDELLLFDYLQMQNMSHEEIVKRYKLAYSMLFGYQGSILIKSGVEGLTTKNGSYDSYRVEQLNLLDWGRIEEYRDIKEFFVSWINFRKNHTKIFDGSGQVETINFKRKNNKFIKCILAKHIKSKDRFRKIIILHNVSKNNEELLLPEFILGDKWAVIGDETGIFEQEIKSMFNKNESFTIPALSTLILKELE